MQENKSEIQVEIDLMEYLIKEGSTKSYQQMSSNIIKKISLYGYSYLLFLENLKFFRVLMNNSSKFSANTQKDCDQIMALTYWISPLLYQKMLQKEQIIFKDPNHFKQKFNQVIHNSQNKLIQSWISSYTHISLLHKKRIQKSIILQNLGNHIKQIQNKLCQSQFGLRNPYEQITINWIISQFQKLRQYILQINHDEFPCCKLTWNLNENYLLTENICYEFKKYTYPFTVNIQFTLKKIIIALLNEKGGVVFIGIDRKDTQKQIQTFQKIFINVIGIRLTKNQVIEFYNKIAQIVENIMPKHSGFPSKRNKSIQKAFKIRDRIKLPINQYINLQFSPLINTQTLQNMRASNNQLYIVKIYVKQGHPSQLYHLINKENTLQFCKKQIDQNNNRFIVKRIKGCQGINKVSQRVNKFIQTMKEIQTNIQKQQLKQKNSEQIYPYFDSYLNSLREKMHSGCWISVTVPILGVKNQEFDEIQDDF